MQKPHSRCSLWMVCTELLELNIQDTLAGNARKPFLVSAYSMCELGCACRAGVAAQRFCWQHSTERQRVARGQWRQLSLSTGRFRLRQRLNIVNVRALARVLWQMCVHTRVR